jgi:serine/threonine-protein kinase
MIGKHGESAAYQIAEVYAWRGERDKAFEWLERAYAQGDGGFTFLRVDPLLHALPTDPRFAAFSRKMNLPPD